MSSLDRKTISPSTWWITEKWARRHRERQFNKHLHWQNEWCFRGMQREGNVAMWSVSAIFVVAQYLRVTGWSIENNRAEFQKLGKASFSSTLMKKHKSPGPISWGKLVSACSTAVYTLQTEDGWKAIHGGSTKKLKFQKSEIESHKFCLCILFVCYIRVYMLMLARGHPCGCQK